MAFDAQGVREPAAQSRRNGDRGIRHNWLIGKRLLVLALASFLVAFVLAATASGALFFLFSPTRATPGDVVTVRLGGTPAGFTLADRRPPFERAIRVYLVPNAFAPAVRSRLDKRLHFVGALVPDRDVRGVLTFRAPPLDSGDYAVAAWCPGCARYSGGQSFLVLPKPQVGRFRQFQALRIRTDVASSCPVTKGPYGNGFLFVHAPGDGFLVARREPDGTLFQKLGWLPKKDWGGNLQVRGERLDGPGQLRVLRVNWGHTYVGGVRGRGSWATPVLFPSEGCWRLTGRVGDVSLTYVMQVVASS